MGQIIKYCDLNLTIEGYLDNNSFSGMIDFKSSYTNWTLIQGIFDLIYLKETYNIDFQLFNYKNGS